MKTPRTIGLGLGLILLFGVGAATFSNAQQPRGKPEHRTPIRAELRERILQLRTEVDLLQLECDATRACLFEWLRDQGKADLMGIDMSALLGTVKLEMGGLSGDAASLKETSDLISDLNGENKEAGLRAIQKTVKKGKDDLRGALDRKKQDFARQARLLNEKKLDLVEAEKQYQSEAR
jgi:hypothetical protein